MRPLIAMTSALSISAALLFGCTHLAPGPNEVADNSLVEYVPEQATLAALPMRVRLPATYRADRVLVFYHSWGAEGWDMMELARAGETWNGEVSCREVSTVTGETRYFFLALDAHGQRVTGTGAPEWPHVATIVRTIPDARGLEGEAAPIRCHDPADCPPDFPGCPSYAMNTRNPAIDAQHDADDQELLAKAVVAATSRYRR
jgi:hypothetical protein